MRQIVLDKLRDRVGMLTIALCLASLGLMATPAPASAFDGERSCACNNLEVCPMAYQRFCCEWSGGSYQCGCSFYITNCNDE